MAEQQSKNFEAWMDNEHPNWRGYQKTRGGKENNIVARMRAAWTAGYRVGTSVMDAAHENAKQIRAGGR